MPATLDALQLAADRLEGRSAAADRYPTPHDLAKDLDPRVVSTPALRLLDQTLIDVIEGRCKRLIWTMPPQEGKSQRVSRTFPAWALCRNPDLRIAIASYEVTTARRWGRAIRNDIKANEERFGLRVSRDTASAGEWQLEDHTGGVYSVGIAGALTGRPVDVLIIDDPIKGRAEAESEVYRERAWDFWVETARTRLAPDAVVIVVLTRWHEDDLAGRLLKNDVRGEWRLVNIPAQAEADDDPLGRQIGEYLESARGRTVKDWEDTKQDVGARGWNSLYQGRPAPAEGALFKRKFWRWYEAPKAVRREDGTMWVPGEGVELIQSWDMTFKDSKNADFVVGQVWMRTGADAWLLDQVRARMDFPATVRAVEALAKRWPQAHAKLVEDKANGPAVIAQLRATVPGLIAINPQDSKFARASAIAPFVEAGNIHLPTKELCPWVDEFVEETAAFPNAPHDDQVDAMSQALHRLLAGQGNAQQAMDWLKGFNGR